MQNKQISLIALCLGFFMVIIDATVVNVSLPSIAKSLDGGVSWLQWIVDSYTLTFACLLLSAGSLGDRLGTKTIFLCGLVLFVLTSFGCGIANSFLLLLIFRLLQGVAAALVVPTSLALINSSYESKIERAKAIGIWGGIGGIAAASGPILGAFLTAWFGWRAVFFINVPIGIVSILLTAKYVLKPVSSISKGGFDIPGQLIGMISIASLSFSLIEAGRLGWFSEVVIAGFYIFVMTFIAFLVIEHRAISPILPLKLFKSQTFSASIAVGMILNMGFYGMLFILPLYFQRLRDYSVFLTGLAILPQPGLAAVASYLGGRMASITGPRLPMVIGLTIGAVGFLAMLITGENTPPYFVLIFPLTAIGFGTAFTMPAATIAVINSAPEGRAGIASGTLNASRQIGSLIGVAIFGTLVNISTHFISGMHTALIIGGSAFLSGSFITLMWVNRNKQNVFLK